MKKCLTAFLSVILTAQLGAGPALAQSVNDSLKVTDIEIIDMQGDKEADALPEEVSGIEETLNPEEDNPYGMNPAEGAVSQITESETEKSDDKEELENNEEPETEPGTISLTYDDRYSFIDAYEGYVIRSIESMEITSRKVIGGRVTSTRDDAVLVQDGGSDTEVIAAGVGTARVILEKEEAAAGEGTDNELAQETVTVEVTVEPAPLTLMYVSGQSNAEGWCSKNTGYRRDQSILCEPGVVYSTYAPTDELTSIGDNSAESITGISFSEYCTRTNAADFVAEALNQNTSITGKELEYALNTLTEDGEGKTGIDSGLAYEWNQLTEDKVWVVNAAWGGSSITSWIPDASLYERAEAVYDQAYRTYLAEIRAGHYTEGDQLLFWLQGEHDKYMSTSEYGGYFQEMYDGLMSDFDYLDGIGVISVRSSLGSYINEEELQMTAPRIVQYLAGASADYENLYVVSNVNEQWNSNIGVTSYFSRKYGSTLSYPMREKTRIPRTMSAVHSDIHYSQLGHNENGITAAEGLYHALYNRDAKPDRVNWCYSTGAALSKLYVFSGQEETVVPVAEPICYSKNVSYSVENVLYNDKLGVVYGVRNGDGVILTDLGEESNLPVSVSDVLDFTDFVGADYTDFYKYQDRWYYLVNGKAALDTTTVAQGTVNGVLGWWYVKDGVVSFTDTVARNNAGWWYVKNGKVDFSYNGVAENEYGWWRIEGGKVNFNFNGFASNSNGWWYLIGGKVQFGVTDVIKGNVNGVDAWWNVQNGQVVFTNTVAKNSNGWWRIEGGKVNFNYNGFASNSNGWWYLTGGKVQFGTNDVLKGTVNGTSGWWNVVNGQVIFTNTVAKNSNGWWFIKNGMVDFTHYGVEKNNNGWWRIEAGAVNFGYNGFASNSNGWWYIRGGKVQFGTNDVINGIVNGTNGWWYVVNGQVTFTNTVAKNSYGWWCVQNGKVNFGYNGIAGNQNGWWYIRGGKVDFSYNGTVNTDGVVCQVVNGKVMK